MEEADIWKRCAVERLQATVRRELRGFFRQSHGYFLKKMRDFRVPAGRLMPFARHDDPKLGLAARYRGDADRAAVGFNGAFDNG